MHERNNQENSGWTSFHTPPEAMNREQLLAELQRKDHELAAYRAEVREHLDQLAEARAQITASRDRYAGLYDLAPVGYVTLDCNGLITDINLLGAEMLGGARKWLTGRPLVSYVARTDRRTWLNHLRSCRDSGPELIRSELWLTPREGEPIYAQLISRLAREEPHTGRFRTAIIDQTERHRAEQAVYRHRAELQQRTHEAEQRSQQLRSLATQLTQAEQRERRKLAQVLHDHIQQLLVAAKMQAGLLKGTDHPTVERVRGQLTEMLDEAIDSSRSLSHELSPQVLYELGLGPALNWLAPRMQAKHGLAVHVEAEDHAEPESEDVRVLMFQAVRELLFNVLKHAEGAEAWVRMDRAGEDRVRIEVEDRGPGFDAEAIDQAKGGEQLGLFGVRERLELMGGAMRIDSAPDRGTRITLIAPAQTDHPGAIETPRTPRHRAPTAASE